MVIQNLVAGLFAPEVVLGSCYQDCSCSIMPSFGCNAPGSVRGLGFSCAKVSRPGQQALMSSRAICQWMV